MDPRPSAESRFGPIGPRPAAAVAAAAGLALLTSLLRPMSFDEAYWITIARRIFGAGDLPYFDLLDNKGPLLYVGIGLFDALPLVGGHGATTAIFVLASAGLAAGVWRLGVLTGQTDSWKAFTAALVVIGAMALSSWALTTEYVSLTLLVWSLGSLRPRWRILFLLAACLVDPRTLLFAAVVLWPAEGRVSLRRTHVGIFIGLAALAVGTVLAVPELRYAFLEASVATRFESSVRDVALIGLGASLPLLTMLTLTNARLRSDGAVVGVVAAMIGISAGLPFGHYWVYLLLVIPLAPATAHRYSVRLTAVAAVAALAVVTATTWGHVQFDIGDHRTHRPAMQALLDQVRTDDRVLVWGRSPLLRVEIAERTLGFAPTSNYFAWGLPDPDRLLNRLSEDLDRASLLVVDTSLDHLEYVPTVGRALALVRDRASAASCVSEADDILIYRFGGC